MCITFSFVYYWLVLCFLSFSDKCFASGCKPFGVWRVQWHYTSGAWPDQPPPGGLPGPPHKVTYIHPQKSVISLVFEQCVWNYWSVFMLCNADCSPSHRQGKLSLQCTTRNLRNGTRYSTRWRLLRRLFDLFIWLLACCSVNTFLVLCVFKLSVYWTCRWILLWRWILLSLEIGPEVFSSSCTLSLSSTAKKLLYFLHLCWNWTDSNVVLWAVCLEF